MEEMLPVIKAFVLETWKKKSGGVEVGKIGYF